MHHMEIITKVPKVVVGYYCSINHSKGMVCSVSKHPVNDELSLALAEANWFGDNWVIKHYGKTTKLKAVRDSIGVGPIYRILMSGDTVTSPLYVDFL